MPDLKDKPRPDAVDLASELRTTVQGTRFGGDLRGATLVGADLQGVDLSGLDLSGADLSGANLTNAKLMGTRLTRAVLDRATLTGAELLGASLEGADLSDVDASNAGFGGADAREADFFNANLSGATFTKATLVGADFRAADMTEARLREADLSHANFDRTRLVDADFEAANLDGANFHDARLDRARFRDVTGFATAHWIGADITATDFCGAYRVRRTIMDENFLHEFKTQSRGNAALYWVWWATSDCGRSMLRWSAVTGVLALIFAGLFSLVEVDLGAYPTALSYVYYSVVTLTTLGYGDVLPASIGAQIMVIVEVVIGYLMLGGLISIMSGKMARRAD